MSIYLSIYPLIQGTSVLERVVAKTLNLAPGTGPGQVGAVIDLQSKTKILGYINGSVDSDGAACLVDGRPWSDPATAPAGSAIAKVRSVVEFKCEFVTYCQ